MILRAALWGLYCVAGCQRAPADASTVKFVSSLPRTGSASQQTTPMVHGIHMALDEAHQQAGSLHVHYEDWDDASTRKGDWDPEVEAGNAERAAQDLQVVAYLGPYNSGAAKISIPILNRAHLAMLSVATYPGLSKPDMGEPTEPRVYRPTGEVNFFRVAPADDIQGQLAAQWISDMGGRSVYVLDDQGLYGRGLAEVFSNAAEDLGIKILGRDSLEPKAQEYRSIMTRVRSLQPDWVYFGGTTQTNAGQVAKDLVAAGASARLMLPDAALDEALVQAAGPQHANGRVFATFGGLPADHLTGAGAAFVERYRARFGTAPEAYAVYGYISAQAALAAAAQVDRPDRDAIRRALAQVRQESGALGSWHFADSGDISLRAMSGSVVRDGHFVFDRVLTPR